MNKTTKYIYNMAKSVQRTAALNMLMALPDKTYEITVKERFRGRSPWGRSKATNERIRHRIADGQLKVVERGQFWVRKD